MKPPAAALLAVCKDCGRLLDILACPEDKSHWVCEQPGHDKSVPVRYVLATPKKKGKRQ